MKLCLTLDVMCLHALREELVTIEIVEHYLRTYGGGHAPPS